MTVATYIIIAMRVSRHSETLTSGDREELKRTKMIIVWYTLNYVMKNIYDYVILNKELNKETTPKQFVRDSCT
jgi:hypothetical protein